MNRQVEFKGKDIEEAIGNAARSLGLPPERVRFTVIAIGSRGFFGLGRRCARIGVDPAEHRVDPVEPQADEVAAAAPAPRDASVGPKKKRAEAGLRPAAPEAPNIGRRPAESPRGGRAPKAVSKAAPAAAGAPAKAEGRALDWSHVPPPLTRPGPGESWSEGGPDEVAELARVELEKIIGLMGFKAEIRAGRIGGRVVLSMETEDSALIIGRRGLTLEALSLLVEQIVGRRAAAGPATRVVVDAADYRARRQEAFMAALASLAEEARRTEKRQFMPGLSPEERRLAHLALRPFQDLRVKSGGAARGLTIAPRRSRREKGGA
ncbi:MAG: Jag N-terminal domain-containing protein [Candidatus Adiutrix sp.]|jgi:spoIIIJ-associated protein|nr:Jag N-terminal domain-containing protein [Candidatus Adiutrix sp.]